MHRVESLIRQNGGEPPPPISGEAQLNTRGLIRINLMAGALLLAACAGPVEIGPTSTPDPLTMSIEEKTIWEIENLRDKVLALVATADDTPAEDLEPILHEMDYMWQSIPEFPLFAAKAGSALREFAFYTYQCYIGKFVEKSGLETIGQHEDHCDQAQLYQETLDLYLQELKEANAGE